MSYSSVLLAIGTYVLAASVTSAETVDVKYRGPIDLKPFDCQSILRSSFINRVCYDPRNQYLVIQLRDTYYHYCGLPTATLEALMTASSMGRYFNANIKGSGKDGSYDCRTHKVPTY